MKTKYPVALSPATISIVHDALTVTAFAMTYQFRIRAEVAEWIWVDVLGGGDRRVGRTLPEAKAFLLATAIEVQVGTFIVRRTLSSSGVQTWLARMENPEANLHQEVLHR